MVVMAAMIGLQYTVHGLSDQLMRQPGALHDGRWWRVFTALFIESSGLTQIVVNVSALAVVGPIAERVLGPRRWLFVFFGSGVVANIVSEGGWSRHGGGSSVAICGLVGALAAVCLLRVGEFDSDQVKNPKRLRLTTLAIPAAGTFLCAITNNHGVGLLTGFVLGLAIATTCPGFPHLGPAKTTVEESSLSGGLAVM
jgi:rhomboid protease GluP